MDRRFPQTRWQLPIAHWRTSEISLVEYRIKTHEEAEKKNFDINNILQY